MCMQCVGAVGTALQAVTVIGGPIAYRGYRRARAALGLPDTSVAAVESRAAAVARGERLPTAVRPPSPLRVPRRAAPGIALGS